MSSSSSCLLCDFFNIKIDISSEKAPKCTKTGHVYFTLFFDRNETYFVRIDFDYCCCVYNHRRLEVNHYYIVMCSLANIYKFNHCLL